MPPPPPPLPLQSADFRRTLNSDENLRERDQNWQHLIEPMQQQPEALAALNAALEEKERRIEALQAVLERKNEEEAAVRASYTAMYAQLDALRSSVQTNLGVTVADSSGNLPSGSAGGLETLEQDEQEQQKEPVDTQEQQEQQQPEAGEPPHQRFARHLQGIARKSITDVNAWGKELALAVKERVPRGSQS